MIVLESFVMVGGREDRALAGHESQHPGPPGRGKTDKSCDWWIFQASSQSHHTHLMAPTQPTFLAQCVLWQAGGLTQREQRIYWELQISGGMMMMRMMTRPGERAQTLSSLSQPGPGTEFQMSSTTATRIYWHFWVSFTFHKRCWPTHSSERKLSRTERERKSSLKIWAGTKNIEPSREVWIERTHDEWTFAFHELLSEPKSIWV